MTTSVRGVKINLTETITTLSLARSNISAAIPCSVFDVVGLADSIDLFVNDEGLINGSPLNLLVTVLAHVLGGPTANPVSVTPDGETIGLTDPQLTSIDKGVNCGFIEYPTPRFCGVWRPATDRYPTPQVS
ncbi:DUF3846 domain-containing protein [Cryobacterium aureum]|uniref:DUF3846 domain-containing protein n=1 Tax=Cryobacterium aureum TaxID=995037 RepID=UPI001374B5F4|nr:DUF3846 domain-containing protein [Cryobacterium aureum]